MASKDNELTHPAYAPSCAERGGLQVGEIEIGLPSKMQRVSKGWGAEAAVRSALVKSWARRVETRDVCSKSGWCGGKSLCKKRDSPEAGKRERRALRSGDRGANQVPIKYRRWAIERWLAREAGLRGPKEGATIKFPSSKTCAVEVLALHVANPLLLPRRPNWHVSAEFRGSLWIVGRDDPRCYGFTDKS